MYVGVLSCLVCTGVLVRFDWSRVVSECRLVHVVPVGPVTGSLLLYYLINTPKMNIYSFNNLKFTLKYLKRCYMFRSHDHPQGAYTVPC
jgi:hypothetical protein